MWCVLLLWLGSVFCGVVCYLGCVFCVPNHFVLGLDVGLAFSSFYTNVCLSKTFVNFGHIRLFFVEVSDQGKT